MIFERSLQRELAYTTGAIFMVLVMIMLTTLLIRIVGFAALGKIDPHDTLTMIGLFMTSYLAAILIVTLFASILFVLTRWYRDAEMIIWLSSGMSLARLIKPIATFSTPIIALIAFCAFVGWPWSHQQSKLIHERFAQRDEASLLVPGQFRESAANHRVFFVESLSPKTTRVRNVFVTSTENDKVNIVVSSQGSIEMHPNGERFVVLENGRRYDGQVDQPDYRIMEFKRYGVRIEDHRFVDTPTTAGTSTLDLMRQPTLPHLAELAWRASLPLMATNLMLLAIPLAYQNLYRERSINLIMAVLIYLTYSNLINLAQSLIEQKKLPFNVGFWLLHFIVAIIIMVFFWWRMRNRSPFARFHYKRK